MKTSALDRLLELRRRRTEKALEVLTMRQGAHRRAQAQAEEAHDAAARHGADARQRERALMASLLGKDITQAALRRVQDNLDVLAIEQRDLQSSAEKATEELAQCGEELQEARKIYRNHHTDAEKLNALYDSEKKRAARHRLVIAETVEEDQIGLAAPRSQVP
jgi:hypothetical protein